MEIKWNMVNNYSAGLKRYSFVSGSNTVYMNTEVPYTDYYGKVADILFSIYDDANHTYDKSLYPEATAGVMVVTYLQSSQMPSTKMRAKH